jgi:RsiW-degrading membrane proteinase PrsW (M82 family)
MGTPVPVVPPGLIRRRRSVLTWVTMIVLGLGALAIAAVVFLSGGPVGGLVVTLLAALSFPLLIAVCFWLDRYEPEPGRYRLAALGWGGVVAVGISLVAEQLLFGVPGTTELIDLAVTAPLVEELGKALFLGVMVLLRRSRLNGVLDGIVYAALVGIGFAFVEDIVYYLSSLTQGALPTVFFLRGIMAPFAHPLFTVATGIGVGLAVSSRQPAVRVFAPIIGFATAVLLHGIWNGSATWGGESFLVAYAAVMLPLLVIGLAFAIWARYQEGRLLRTALLQVVEQGWVPLDDVRWVARLGDRMSARAWVRRRGGSRAALALGAYQQLLTEIAFLHSRAMNGTAPVDVNAQMNDLLHRASALRPFVLMPPTPLVATPPGWHPAPPPPG